MLETENETKLKKFLPYIQLFIAIIAVSFAAIIVVYLQKEELLGLDVPSEVIAMYRTLFAGIGAFFLSFYGKKITWLKEKATIKKIHWCVLAGLFLAIHFATWFLSLKHVDVAISTTLVDTVPIFLAIFGFIFFREKIRALGIIGISIAFTGGVLLAFALPNTSAPQQNPMLGIVFALIGAITVAFYFLIGKKILKDSPLWPYFAIVNLSSALFLLIYCLIRGYNIFSYSYLAFVLILLMAIGPSLIGHATYNYSLKKIPAFVVGVAILGEPIGAAILGVIFLKQIPVWYALIYAFIILIGIVLTSISQNVKINIFRKKVESEIVQQD
ncbi:MAG: DMT family transporter [Candidatus Thorarchaeota archaeon]